MTKRLQFCVRLAVACIALVPARSAAGQEVTLRYRWTKGEEFRYRTTQQISTTASGTGIPGDAGAMSTDQTVSHIIRTIVDDVAADGTATLRQVVESIRLEMSTPLGRKVVDSATVGGDASADSFTRSLSVAYAAMLGEPIMVVTTSPTGAVKKIEGMARILEKMSQNPAAAGLQNLLTNNLTDELTRDMSALGFAPFPDRALKPGDSWDGRFTASLPITGAITTSSTSTFQGVERRGDIPVARITAKLTMNTDPAAVRLQAAPFAMQIGEGTGERELLFDIAKGRMQRLASEISQPMTMSGTAPDGNSFNMRTVAKTTMILEMLDR